MKSILIIPFTLLFLTSLSYAQEGTPPTVDWSPEIYQVGKIYPGYIIELEGDTIKGYIKALNRCSTGGIGKSNQNWVEFYSSPTDKKPLDKFNPKKLKGYKIADKIYESISYSGGLLKAPNFNLVIKDGAIRIYEWYSTVENFSSIRKQSGETWEAFDARRYESNIIFAKTPSEPEAMSSFALGYRKKMSAFVGDNTALANKINDKEKGYGLLNIYAVIHEYNEWARTNK